MEYSAIFHDTTKKYCYAMEKGVFVIRLKTKKNDLKRVTLHWRDKSIPVEVYDTRKQMEMKKIVSDNYSDYYEAQIIIDMACLRYQFELEDMDGEIVYYSNHEFYKEIMTNIDYMYNCTQNLREEEMFKTPKWAENKIVYQIFPSRFASSKNVDKELWYKTPIEANDDLQGDLRGVIEHLEHLKALGADILYMTPIFTSPSTHKYNTTDYYKIDPSFGTEEDLKELVEKAHNMGMKVILDAVFNHTGTDFFAFRDIQENGENSKYLDWYYVDELPLKMEWGTKPNYKCFAYFGGMPKLNLQNEETINYCIEVGRYWLERCNIDGWRLDVADEISHKFWRRFRTAMKAVNPEALIIGEIWYHAEDFLDGDEWDTVMNYPFYFAMEDLLFNKRITISEFFGRLGYLEGNLHKKVYPILWNLLDSHDTPRFLHRCQEDMDCFKFGVAVQFLFPGMPFIYYGDEYGMTGGADPDCRRGMLWDESYQNKEIYDWYRKLITIRKQYPVLTEGQTTEVCFDDEKGLCILTKELEQKNVISDAHFDEELSHLSYAKSQNVSKITLVIHAKDGNLKIDCAQFENTTNILENTKFLGNLGGFEVAVLV